MPISEQLKHEFQVKLLKWFELNKREFQWRFTKNPYEILVAELMLQRTNAGKVEKVYIEFVKKYPDFNSLLNASDDKLKRIWKPLGLQNEKIRILKDLAKKAIENYDAKVPFEKEELMDIRGIGQYISNAILCFAYNRRVPLVDDNIVRILERAFNIKSLKKNPLSDKEIWRQMELLLPQQDIKKFNYALLDFGGLVCKFYSPKCEICFFAENCYYLKNLVVKDKKSN